QLEAALEYIREGDVLVVCKLDRLARSTQHLLEIVERVKRKGAHLQILNLGMDTSTATGKLLLTMIAAIGQFEREMMLERQREGIVKAKSEGKYKGRAPTARVKAAQARALRKEGVGATEIARRLKIGPGQRLPCPERDQYRGHFTGWRLSTPTTFCCSAKLCRAIQEARARSPLNNLLCFFTAAFKRGTNRINWKSTESGALSGP